MEWHKNTSLFSKVYNIDISAKELSFALEKISNLAFQWKMQLNPDPNKQVNEFFFKKNKKQLSFPVGFSNNDIKNMLIAIIWALL